MSLIPFANSRIVWCSSLQASQHSSIPHREIPLCFRERAGCVYIKRRKASFSWAKRFSASRSCAHRQSYPHCYSLASTLPPFKFHWRWPGRDHFSTLTVNPDWGTMVSSALPPSSSPQILPPFDWWVRAWSSLHSLSTQIGVAPYYLFPTPFSPKLFSAKI